MLHFSLENTNEINLLCLGAHCDDIEIGCGGTILKLIENYKINHIKWIVFSSNEVRKKEALTSAKSFLKQIDNKRIEVLDYQDGYLPRYAKQIKDYFEELKKDINPSVIFTHYRNDLHQDHRIINELTWNTFRNHTILEYEIPKFDGDLGIPNFYVPLTEDIVTIKNKIILDSFKSQNSKHWFDSETFNSILRIRGMESVTKFAEAFYARKILL